MKATKIKRYRLGVSLKFPATHPRKGEDTNFVESIKLNMALGGNGKIHTIRANYEFWKKRMDEVQAGNAVIELYHWAGKAYNSKQVVFTTIDKNTGCGVQELEFINSRFNVPFVYGKGYAVKVDINDLAENDGLIVDDFKDWFRVYDLSKPMGIIHFTKFRY